MMESLMGNGNGINATVKTLFEYGFRVVTLALLPLLFWMASTLNAIDRRVVTLETRRANEPAAVELLREIMIRPTFEQVPPKWFQEQLDERYIELKERIERLENR